MIHEKYELSCGAHIDVLQAEDNQVAMIRISAPGRGIEAVAQVNSDRVMLAIDPKDFQAIYQIAKKLAKPLWKRWVNYVFLGKEL